MPRGRIFIPDPGSRVWFNGLRALPAEGSAYVRVELAQNVEKICQQHVCLQARAPLRQLRIEFGGRGRIRGKIVHESAESAPAQGTPDVS